MVRRLHHLIHRQVARERPDRHRLENPACLPVRKTAAFHVVRVVRATNLQAVVEATGNTPAFFRFQGGGAD